MRRLLTGAGWHLSIFINVLSNNNTVGANSMVQPPWCIFIDPDKWGSDPIAVYIICFFTKSGRPCAFIYQVNKCKWKILRILLDNLQGLITYLHFVCCEQDIFAKIS